MKNSFCGRNGEALSSILNYDISPRVPVWGQDVERNWYAVYTSPCHEKQVAEQLAIREIEHYLPLYQLSRRWKDGRRVTLQAPLFPSYLFVHAARQQRGNILGVPGILSIVGTSRGAIALPTAEIESLRDGLHLHNAAPHPFLTVGEKARIRNGSLAGMQGIVLRHKNSTRIILGYGINPVILRRHRDQKWHPTGNADLIGDIQPVDRAWIHRNFHRPGVITAIADHKRRSARGINGGSKGMNPTIRCREGVAPR